MELVRKIRYLNILVVFMLLLQLAVYPASALGDVKKATITVDQATQIVKDSFNIPEKYTQLSTGYNEYNNRGSYSLNWNATDAPGGSFHAEVDSSTGDILSINQWEGPRTSAFKLPTLSALEAEKIATDLVSKLAGTHKNEMQLVKDEQQLSISNFRGPFTYDFRWVRIVNGIQFPENGINVSISGDGGISNYNYNWTSDLNFPEATDVITPETANQVFSDTPMFELQYFLPQRMNPMNHETSEPQRVFLVYQLANKYPGGAIDALTGKPVTLDQAVGINKSKYGVSSVAVPTSAEAKSVIQSTDQDTSDKKEQISQADAAAVVKKMLKIPSGLVLRNSSLSPDYQNTDEQVWNLDYGSESYNDQGYFNARVNARTGELVGFNMSNAVKPNNKAKSLSRDEARKLAEDFLERVQPDKFKLVKDQSGTIYEGMPDDNQFFNYVRVVNGIPVANNGMNISVDTAGKQVINYDLSWTDVEFPSPAEVLPMNQVTERFLKERPLKLNYTLIFQKDKKQKQEVRLVYQPNINYRMYATGMIDAKTGNFMDWYGKSQSEWSMPHTYTDIQGNYAEKEIGIMGLTGAFGEYGEAFRPDEKVTAGSLLRAMIAAEGMNRERVLTDEDVLKIAKERTWIHDNLDLGAELSRENLSKIMIRLISMESSAQVKGIYVVPFTDADTIKPDSLGYIALTWGLGILKIEGNAVQLNQSVTRAEAAYALVHAYALQPLSSDMKYYY